MRLIDGRAIAAAIAAEVTAAVTELTARGVVPTLAVVVPTGDEATAWYVRSIERAAARVGITCRVDTLTDPDGRSIAKHLDELSADPTVHGIICQTPLPEGVTLDTVGRHIAPAKDVDGANPVSLGRLVAGLPTYAPATAAAVLEILRREEADLAGAHAVVVGRSTVVGKPAALLLLAEHATVTVCHSRTRDLPRVCADADVLVAAVGRAHLVGAEHIKPGAVVIDVGTNPTADGGLAGDVDPDGAQRAGSLTPVPGGVGPVTTMLLMRHTVQAAAREV
ncbi:bifunctional 5,10-methylenetetrahydrofolate dehydrogenase/5,10-methenyltetrahydrofolate cyclohydrolase [Micromonospora sp. NBC_00421]|uniref:bifunctional 5,10-methylenetetrahydrofolate dehydrogenase/5,10-methenyltetrahydrofolate cyclohydrolase n=1 Tax=Micromonospora sp. NBC_00421 TaxID=2975976 RepID=UPI002E238C07